MLMEKGLKVQGIIMSGFLGSLLLLRKGDMMGIIQASYHFIKPIGIKFGEEKSVLQSLVKERSMVRRNAKQLKDGDLCKNFSQVIKEFVLRLWLLRIRTLNSDLGVTCVDNTFRRLFYDDGIEIFIRSSNVVYDVRIVKFDFNVICIIIGILSQTRIFFVPMFLQGILIFFWSL
jgi:hypothetical protein